MRVFHFEELRRWFAHRLRPWMRRWAAWVWMDSWVGKFAETFGGREESHWAIASGWPGLKRPLRGEAAARSVAI
jgi:hypothetical protein